MTPSSSLDRFPFPVLIADIGGTNARFALADPHAASPLLVASVREFPVAAFPSLAEAAAHYLDQVGTRARRGVARGRGPAGGIHPARTGRRTGPRGRDTR